MKDQRSARLRRWSLALGTSSLAWGIILPAAAHAQCLPDPTTTNGTTNCTGNDTDGIRVATPNAAVMVASDAIVSGVNTPAITVEVPNSISSITEQIIVAGQVSGDNQSAISLLTGPVASYNGSTTHLVLTVAKDASVAGLTALSMAQTAGNTYGQLIATINNAGELAGSGGVALRGDIATTDNGFTTTYSGFDSITNQASGIIIGSIVGPLASLTNAGLIDGGSASALTTGSAGSNYLYTLYPGTWANSGTIRSNAAAAAIISSTIGTLANSGTITNTGTGAALSSPSYLNIQNQPGGTINASGTAISATGLALINQGIVSGNVVTGNASSTVDSAAGTINGSVTFGSGNDTLVARYVGTSALATGITGAINGGGGTNAERVAFSSDTRVTTPVDLAAGFQQLVLAPEADVTATLDTGFSSAAALVLSGQGTVVNRAVIALTGTAVSDLDYAFGSRAAFRNEGSITANLPADSTGYGLTFSNHSFDNSGTVTVTGGRGAVSMFYNPVVNSGTITATGTGVDIFDGVLTNSGSIMSTAGTGISLNGNVGYTAANSGSIWGAAIGASTGIYLTNSGTIGSAGTAVAVQPYGYLINTADGVVNGGSRGAVTVSSFNAGIANAGTINGDVTFNGVPFSGSNLTYIALTGGTLNGNLTLTGGATLVTDMVNTGPGAFAGIIGTVTADSGSALRYAVSANTSAVVPSGNVGPFSNLGYQLSNGAALTLAAPTGQTRTQPLTLAGNGSVDLNVNFAVTDAAAIQSAVSITYPGAITETGALSITSRGTIAVMRSAGSTSYLSPAGVSLAGTDTFTNLGTITVSDRNSYTIATGISGGALVTNAGSILLDGGTGIAGGYQTTQVVNTGTIVQVDGGSNATGLAGAIALDNSGTIRVGGNAITAYYGSQITNSGTIASTGGIAITGADTSASATITNAAGGTITGTGGTAVRLYSGTFTNAGAVNGSVDMGYGYPYYAGAPTRSYASSTFVAANGTVAGDLLFGDGNDFLLQTGDTLGVSGAIDGGGGIDIYGRSLVTSGTVALGSARLINFEDALVQAVGGNTVVTTTGSFGGNLYAVGTGSVVNQATLAGMLTTTLPYNLSSPYSANPLFPADQILASLTNAGSVASVSAVTSLFTNSGSIGQSAATSSYYPAVALSANDSIAIANSGQIAGGLSATVYHAAHSATATSFTNSGTITGTDNAAAATLTVYSTGQDSGGAIHVDNSGTLATHSASGYAQALTLDVQDSGQPHSYAITNSGTIAATADTKGVSFPSQANALFIAGAGLSGTISNAVGATISASGDYAYAVLAEDSPLTLVNAGTITATGTAASVAIATFDGFDNRITNTGMITGNILLAGGVDRLDNAGVINGAVMLGAGEDSFVQRGVDSYTVDTSTGTATLTAPQFINFERLTQTGNGTGFYAGQFAVNTITLAGGTLAVRAGQTLATQGSIAITAAMGSGNLAVVNAGTIAGRVQLGAGDDSYTEVAGSLATGGVDGGSGTDLYRVELAGDRMGIGARTGFEQLAVTGTGTLTLALDQNFQSVALAGTGLTTRLGDFTIDRIDGSAAAEQVVIDGDVATVALAAGDDMLTLGATIATGRYSGGAGADALRFTAAAPVMLTGAATSFETVALAGGALTVAGTLGANGDTLAFGDGNQSLTIAAGGTLAGTIDLGGGNDSFTIMAGGILSGSVSGGTGFDTATLELAGNATFRGELTNFEQLVTQGSGMLSLAGRAYAYDSVTAATDLTVAADASLTTTQLTFGNGTNRLSIAGRFTGAVTGRAGSDSIDISGGSEATPVAFTRIADVEALRMSAGFASVSDSAQLGAIALTGGRLVGYAGSTITAPTITIGKAATFGSAGTVNGNIAVAGTLSPGASPGTMTVNGNIVLAGGSTSLFEITPTISDLLLVNGSLTINPGSTLQLVAGQGVTAGRTLDLIVASGGIIGSYTNIIRSGLFGIVIQQADRLSLLGAFLNDPGYTANVQRSIAYVNSVLTSGQTSAALLAVIPRLANASGVSNQASFAQITPEAYASARQIAVENGLTLADASRSDAFASHRDTPGLFSFGSALANTRTIEADADQGTSRARTNGYGFLAGIGWGGSDWSVGGFAGYLNSRQQLGSLSARTKANGIVAGIHGRWTDSAWGVKATIAYDGGDANTRRLVPGSTAQGRYDLHGWTSDVSLTYTMPISGNWTVRPSLGATAIRTTTKRIVETGNSPFALDVARQRSHVAFVDGALTFSGGSREGEAVKPYLSIGVRYQADGRVPFALAAWDGGGYGLVAAGTPRAPVLATATIGSDVALSSQLSLFGALSAESGDADHRASGRAGLRLAF
jgi:hypothetical protein